MILFWMKAFKKPSEGQNKELLDMYMALSAENQKKVNRKTKITIGAYFTLAILCLLASTVILGLELLAGIYTPYGLVLDLVFFGLSIYATYTSSTWMAAKPYQRILLCADFAESLLYNQPVVEVDTAQYNIEHSADVVDEDKKEDTQNTPAEEPAKEEPTQPADDKKE